MLNSTSAFSPKGNGLYTGQVNGGYSGVGLGSNSLFGGSSLGGSRVTSKVASYLRTEYSSTIEKAQRYLAEGDFDKAMEKIESLRKQAQSYASENGYSIDTEQISTALNKAGANFDNYIDESSKGSFATGLFNGIPLAGLFFDSYSKNEIQAKVSNEDVRLVDKIKEGAGKVISGGLTGFIVSGCNPIGAVAGIAIAFGQNSIKDWICAQ